MSNLTNEEVAARIKAVTAARLASEDMPRASPRLDPERISALLDPGEPQAPWPRPRKGPRYRTPYTHKVRPLTKD